MSITLKRKSDWVGLRVRARSDLQNGWCIIAKGTVLVVTYSRAGLHLESEPCETCGVKVRISRVSESKVEILPNQVRAIYPDGKQSTNTYDTAPEALAAHHNNLEAGYESAVLS